MTPDHLLADLAPDGQLVVAINLGNTVLAQGTAAAPRGVTVDLAHEIASRLGVAIRFVCFDAARKSFQELAFGHANLAFLAIEPARASEVSFTRPYVMIDGVYAVPEDSDLRSPEEIDASGIRIGVKEGSAYDLFLTRTVKHATITRGTDGTSVFAEQGLEVAAGIRQPLTGFVAEHPELRLIDKPFMQIQQAVATRRTVRTETVGWLDDLVLELLDSGFVAKALLRSHQPKTIAAKRNSRS
jgi:polar amino acid transport system substrate-binding protein